MYIGMAAASRARNGRQNPALRATVAPRRSGRSIGTRRQWQNTEPRPTRSYGPVIRGLSAGTEACVRAHLTERVCIEVGDTLIDEASLPGHQGRLALAYLLVAHRPVSRDELADLLWRGEPPTSWEKGLGGGDVEAPRRAGPAGAGRGRAHECVWLLPAAPSVDRLDRHRGRRRAVIIGGARLGAVRRRAGAPFRVDRRRDRAPRVPSR